MPEGAEYVPKKDYPAKSTGSAGTAKMGPGSSLRKPQTQQAAKRKPENPNLLPDGRIKCIHCGRGFAADRIDKHQAVCSSLNNIKFTKPGETVRKQTTYGVKGAVGYVDRATSDFSGKKIAGTP